MTELIFNADDFGLSPSANRSIVACARAGLLKSASLMVTHHSAEDAVRLVDSLDEPIRLGLHFCLTSGRAVSPATSIPLLAAPDGRFKNGFLSLLRLLTSSCRAEVSAQVALEFEAQYRRFERLLSLAPRTTADHLDSHQHIHVFPPMMKLFGQKAQQAGLVLRIPSEPVICVARLFRPPVLSRAGGYAKKRILDHFIHKTPEAFASAPIYFGVIDSGRMDCGAINAVLDALPRLLKRKKEKRQVELNLHPWKIAGEKEIVPQYASAADRAFGNSPLREEEFNALVKHAPQIQAKMSDLGFTTSYFRIPARRR
ncbi:MAG: carbohydrate deacetylase [Thermoguttaceae bacterium]|jgi:predicted glycoside hydrolase/deacetylase ChbG (UPF0249 family)